MAAVLQDPQAFPMVPWAQRSFAVCLQAVMRNKVNTDPLGQPEPSNWICYLQGYS